MKLHAISDIHVSHPKNREFLGGMGRHPEDWLILGGDVGETEEDLVAALRLFCARFARVLWVPGNHELWSVPEYGTTLRGMAKYERLVSICRDHGVITPEDPYVDWPGPGPAAVIAPLFLLYDYTFRPGGVPAHRAVPWAAESGVVCADEELLHPDPYPTREALCAARCAQAEERLAAIAPGRPTVLINHFPLRADLAILPAIPRFSIWCGTTRTEDWHTRFRAAAVVYGHLHIPGTRHRDGVRFEEVSLGYPGQRRRGRGPEDYLREILPGPPAAHR
jgi:predicted phosphodiesterase